MIIAELLTYPFMQRALIAGAILGVLLASLGVLATLRKMAFFGEGVAHASLAGIAIALLAGFAPLPFAIAWAIFIAVVIYALERSTKLPSDTLIGILFTASMALGVILIGQTQGYQPELLSFLFGSILTIRGIDLIVIASFAVIIMIWLLASLRQLTYLSLSEESAAVAGIPVKLQTLLLYIALAIATVLGVKILGIILVPALIVLPPATSRMLTHSFKSYFVMSIVIAEVVILSGLVSSYIFDFPSGATIVLVGTVVFLTAAAVSGLTKKS
ncbi:MAG: metal ABC transporter permease [Candidatus Uhrbacteria bacterium]|nr:metal ABC transporter permease [Candidatus Uhrbacteria bacterium]